MLKQFVNTNWDIFFLLDYKIIDMIFSINTINNLGLLWIIKYNLFNTDLI